LLYNYQEMSSSAVSTSSVSTSSESFTGRVKWFNNKAGYGFITVTDGVKSGTDVFVHHSFIKVDNEQYKYLVQGEYVEFKLLDTMTDRHEFQAGEVCGIKGGKLMCETRRESRVSRYQYNATQQTDNDKIHLNEPVKMPRQVSPSKTQRTVKSRGQGPREDAGEWTSVPVSRKSNNRVVSSNTSQRVPTSKRGRPPKSSQKQSSETQA
jgi:CspA family cold shock protein